MQSYFFNNSKLGKINYTINYFKPSKLEYFLNILKLNFNQINNLKVYDNSSNLI